MPFALILIAAIFIVTGFRGTIGNFLSTLSGDASGFVVWIVAIGVIGAVGYIPGMKRISDAFLALVLLVLFLRNGGFFAKFQQGIKPTGMTSNSSNAVTVAPLAALPGFQPYGGSPSVQSYYPVQAGSLPGG